ncbi:MAG: ASKHA domain-containing protein [Acidimicrobiia bacterium]|nr:MAG: ASKHA domain-containing protein [Acidimicrobiia bacterium]
MTDKTVRVFFTPSGRQAEIALGTSLLDAARVLGVDLASVCGGRGLCGRCQVDIPPGEYAKHGVRDNEAGVTAWTEGETEYAERDGLEPGRRLGCKALVAGPVVVDVPPSSRVHRQVVRKRVEVRDFEIDPAVTLHFVAVEPPDLSKPSGDLTRLRRALHHDWGIDPTQVDHHVLADLQTALRTGGWEVTVAVHDGETISAVWPGFRDLPLGIAIDIGSTTIAGHLMNLESGATLSSEGVMNPQIRFGEDLMSRVSYAMLNEGGAEAMTAAVKDAVSDLIRQLADSAGCHTDDILELVVVGNPIMHHLFLGLDPTPLGTAPFALATDQAIRMRAIELGIPANAGARLYVLPSIAGHVGADAAAVILSEEPHRSDKISLVVDVGTNAEIILGNEQRLLAASSPTGPAFEGAQISAGQRAAPGAIERVRIYPETLDARVKVIGHDAWSDDVEFGDTAITGICGSGIIEAVAEMYLAGILTSDGVIDGELASRSDRIIPDGRTYSYVLIPGPPDIMVTQDDVRAIQLAKAALHAGCKLLMDHLAITSVDRIRLAGAFGSLIDPMHALVLGLVPDCDLDEVTAAGNAAASGALIALLNVAARRTIEELCRTVEKVETAVEPAFQDYFVAAMSIPHSTDPYERLGRSVDLPVARKAARAPRGRRRNARPSG